MRKFSVSADGRSFLIVGASLVALALAGAGAAAVVNLWFAVIPGGAALAVLAGAWAISPRRA